MGRFVEVKEDLRRFITNENIDVAMTERERQIVIHGVSSGQTLEITYDGQEYFRLKEDLGSHPKGFQTQVTVQPPRWSGRDPITQSEVLTKAKGWLNSQRAHLGD